MKILYLDCFAGISGDMFVGALLDLGLQQIVLERELNKLPVGGYHLNVTSELKNGIQAVAFRVYLEEKEGHRLADSEFEETTSLEMPSLEMPSLEMPSLEMPPAQMPPETSNRHKHTAEGRSPGEIEALIKNSELSEWVKSTSISVFKHLGEAEAKVHGMAPDQVHFHEVGGVDAIIDIVSAAVGLEALGIEKVYASPLHLGGGFVRSSHGLLPVPAPATTELLKGVPVYTTQHSGELVTPTGAAILTTIAAGFRPMPEMIVQSIGYGAGSRKRAFPNVLRAYLGESQTDSLLTGRSPRDPNPQQHTTPQLISGYHESPAVVLEANIDDSNPQWYEHLMDLLLEAGALDIALIPVQMKKNRPGIIMQVLAQQERLDQLIQIIFRNSTTIGIRTHPVQKQMLQREILSVDTPYGALHVKISKLGAEIVNVTPEYEDCKALAIQHGISIKEVWRIALAAYESASEAKGGRGN